MPSPQMSTVDEDMETIRWIRDEIPLELQSRVYSIFQDATWLRHRVAYLEQVAENA